MPATDRLDSERLFHDAQARHRAADLALRGLVFADDDWLDHESWVRPAVARLGELSGRRVLDYGCGHGMAAVVLARRGAAVTAFDLSDEYLREAARRAGANGVRVAFVKADGHALPFVDGTFDAVWGNAILHHLDLTIAGRELIRILRPGGVAVFCEPWGDNPLLALVRRRFPYPGKARTPDERPLRSRDLARLRESFPGLEVEGFQLLSMVRRAVRAPRLIAGLERCDRWLLRAVPGVKKMCRYVVLTLRRG